MSSNVHSQDLSRFYFYFELKVQGYNYFNVHQVYTQSTKGVLMYALMDIKVVITLDLGLENKNYFITLLRENLFYAIFQNFKISKNNTSGKDSQIKQ